MPTVRTPIRRPPRRRITDHALDLFQQMIAAEPYTPEWHRLSYELRAEVQMKPWQIFNIDRGEPGQHITNRTELRELLEQVIA